MIKYYVRTFGATGHLVECSKEEWEFNYQVIGYDGIYLEEKIYEGVGIIVKDIEHEGVTLLRVQETFESWEEVIGN